MRISVEGNIGSGKSECLDALAAAFPNVPCYPEPVQEWGELLELFYKCPADWALSFSLKVLLGFRDASRREVCIVERSPMASRHVFSQLLYNDGTLSVQEWELFKDYHRELGWEPGVVFFVDTPAAVCLERIASRGRSCEAGIDIDYLRRVEFQYANMLRYTDVPVVRFDGTLPPAELHAQMVHEAAARLPPTRAAS